ncbi:ArsR/SmtB family transcription factor [Streptomyces sp. NPDC101393]|uniref:ArsR/SmtB family transcription factor n=1 Tax=Streptomyces sp. NPDC101393 TaxID=3366141 RepID=UPI0038008CC8
MIRIRFTSADFAGVRFAARPAPLQELNVALMRMCLPHDELLFGRWRRRLLHALPPAAGALRDLVPGARAPAFLDVVSDTLQDGLDTVRAARPELVRAEIERVHAPPASPPPPWIRALHGGDAEAWHVLRRAQRAAFDTVLRPVWPLVQDLHQAEFTRHALTAAEHGTGAALTALFPGSRLREDTWEIGAPRAATEEEAAPPADTIELGGRGLLLMPTFHWTGRPLVADLPGGPLALTYPAGAGLPLTPEAGGSEDPLAAVLGATRAEILFLLAEDHTTSGLARRLGVSNATASAHTAALRGAGLIATTRAGRAVLHRRTAMGSLLLRRRGGTRSVVG